MATDPPHRLKFQRLPDRYAVCRFRPSAEVPPWVGGKFVFIARSDAELSIVTSEAGVPDDVVAERGMIGFRIAGPLHFSEVGILQTVSEVLSNAIIPVFVISTFDTDYFFIREAYASTARAALVAAGHTFGNL